MSSYKLKILICGPAGVGKTSLIMRFVKSFFKADYKMTIGIGILTKDLVLDDNQTCTLSLWDVGGQKRFQGIRSTFYKGAAGVLLVFDLSRADTWDELKEWRAEIKQVVGEIPFVLIGNKLDLYEDAGEVIDRDECKEYADSQNSIYIETSAKENVNVEESFVALAKKIINSNP